MVRFLVKADLVHEVQQFLLAAVNVAHENQASLAVRIVFPSRYVLRLQLFRLYDALESEGVLEAKGPKWLVETLGKNPLYIPARLQEPPVAKIHGRGDE